MGKIIINADDFGISDGVCRSIIELLQTDAITSTTIMCAADGALERLKKFDMHPLQGHAGVHLQATSGSPLLPIVQVSSLITPEGKFKSKQYLQDLDPEQVEQEWRRQIEVASDLLGAEPTHLDTHHSVHLLPDLLPIYLQLAKEFDLAVRNPYQGEPLGFTLPEDKTSAKQVPVTTTDFLLKEWTGTGQDEDKLKEQVEALFAGGPTKQVSADGDNKYKFVEIMVHPGYSDSYLQSVSSWSEVREVEHAALLALTNYWPQTKHQLVSFVELYS